MKIYVFKLIFVNYFFKETILFEKYDKSVLPLKPF